MLYLLIPQLAALILLIELFVRGMPQALKRASRQNCYRVDGTLSAHRSHRESRARNRLRKDLVAVMLLVFLTGNALYFTIDNTCKVDKLLSYVANRATTSNAVEVNRVLGEEVQAQTGSRDASPEVAFEGIKKDIPWIVTASSAWLVLSCVVIGFGAMKAYREFANGVNSRAAEHFHLDMTRMSVSDNEIASELLQRDSSHGAA